MKNKTMTIIIIFLLAALVFQTAYLFHEKNQHRKALARSKFEPPPLKQLDFVHPNPSRQSPTTPRQHTAGTAGFDDPFEEADWDSWDPFVEMETIHRGMNRMFQQSMNRAMRMAQNAPGLLTGPQPFFEPDIDIVDAGDRYVIKFDLPGMDKDKIDVAVSGHTLRISGERKSEKEDQQEGKFYRVERSFGSFQRSIPLPDDADTEQVNAEYQNGVLTVALTKLNLGNRTAKPASKVEIG